ncbi:MAG: Mrp/NBP35 family ATP-binding protein [Micrococcales bacterium]|nr:Mrp/NBP35 family ATP-binding protein [Micrococcales bacterium]
MGLPTEQAVRAALATVTDPEIGRPITELGMVRSVEVGDSGSVTVEIALTVAGCPMRLRINQEVEAAVSEVEGVGPVTVKLGVMTDAERAALAQQLSGVASANNIFGRVLAVASGKGGVGKSSLTANLAVALASRGLAVGVLDADIFGFSMPRMLGVESEPVELDGLLVPPVANGVKVFSMGMLVPPGQPIVWRGPVLHRALTQFVTEVFWGELDFLLVDLPPGTGDVPLSVAQLLPTSEVVVVTTPQVAAAEVAQRAGAMAVQTKHPVAGVVENMSWLTQPDGSRLELFGTGGGQQVADNLSQQLGQVVQLLGQVPLDMAIRQAGDKGQPVVIGQNEGPASAAYRAIASKLAPED